MLNYKFLRSEPWKSTQTRIAHCIHTGGTSDEEQHSCCLHHYYYAGTIDSTIKGRIFGNSRARGVEGCCGAAVSDWCASVLGGVVGRRERRV